MQVVAWACKDYGDGWIQFETLQEACQYQYQTHCVMRPVWDYPAPKKRSYPIDKSGKSVDR